MPLRLDLLRHGDALPAGSGGDDARSLSPLGRRDCARVAEEFARHGWRPDRIYSSPLRRAIETAEILSRVAPGLVAATLPELTPDGTPDELVEALRRVAPWEHVILVGHQPLLGRLSAYLTGRSEAAFPPAGLVRVAFTEGLAAGKGRIELQIRPEHLP